jgi:MYXO-CTERM domain-containing protein
MDSNGNLYGTTEGAPGGLTSGTVFELSPVPEPSSLALGLLALGGLVLVGKRKIAGHIDQGRFKSLPIET